MLKWRGKLYLTYPSFSHCRFFSEAWREQPCLLLFGNLVLCRTPQRGSSCSKLGTQTLWRQPVQRQIGQGALYVKLKTRQRRSAGHSFKNSFCCRNSDGVPPSKLLCTVGATGTEGTAEEEVKLDRLDGTELSSSSDSYLVGCVSRGQRR